MPKQFIHLVMKAAPLVLLLSVLAGLVILWRQSNYASVFITPVQEASEPVTAYQGSVPDAGLWSSLGAGGGNSQAHSESPLRERYRLAGTFEVFGEANSRVRRAIIDDMSTDSQFLVSEDETVADLKVLHIFSDRIRVLYQGREDVLPLGFADPSGNAEAEVEPERLEEPAGEQNAFGRRVGEGRWIIEKAALLDYYERLKDDPERLVSLYEAFRPVYAETGEGGIQGYQLDVKLEPELLEAAGLKQDDVVRSVNSMDMSSRQRGEYFVSEFLQGRLSAVVLDVERDGEAKRLIYMIR